MTGERQSDEDSDAVVGRFHIRGRKRKRSLGGGVSQEVSSHVVMGWDPNTGSWVSAPGLESGTSDLRLPHLRQSPSAHLKVDAADTNSGDYEEARDASYTQTGDYKGRPKGDKNSKIKKTVLPKEDPKATIAKEGGFHSPAEAKRIAEIHAVRKR